ncbi:MAG: DUF6265 family protein [Myxococcaceae bacterium]
MMLVTLLLLSAAPECPPVGPTSPGISQLGWLGGAWSGDDRGTLNEEVWLAPAGGLMLGMHRDTAGGKATGFEFLRIEQDGEGLVYRAMPEGRPATEFRRMAQGPGCIVFENPEHAFPRRILYWRDGQTLHARIEGSRQGKPASREWAWHPSS